MHTSPLGLVPKPHTDKWRLIFDLSSPWDHSVNDGIALAHCSLQYASVDNAIDIIRQLGRGTQLLKVDLANAYRIVPVHPDDQPLLGMRWCGGIFLDWALPFGLRSSPKIFTAVADLLAWVLYCEEVTLVIHYLDDFLVFKPPSSSTSCIMRSRVESILNHIGAPIVCHKTEGPASTVAFLGIQIDTDLFQLSLPNEKICRLHNLLHQWCTRRSCTKKNWNHFWATWAMQPQ